MVHILLDGYDFGEDWLRRELGKYMKPTCKVAVLAFSFRDRVKSLADWNALYAPGGKFYAGQIGQFAAYGIPKENVTFLNYFTDTKESAAKKIKEADIVYFLGGLPDRMMDRIREFELEGVLTEHGGIVMGYSAGAVIQLTEYHLSPDGDYPEFGYYRGLPYLDGFYLEVHYEGTDVQKDAIRRVLAERGKPVYAIGNRAGGILVDGDGNLRLLGRVQKFEPGSDCGDTTE